MTSFPDWVRRARGRWGWNGEQRPPFAEEPGPGEESVWDYPRPPRIERDDREVVVRHADLVLARSASTLRVLETASPPTFYLPPGDVRTDLLVPHPGTSRCEWKGEARYWTLETPTEERVRQVGWSYPDPLPGFEEIADHLSFYPARVECFVGWERVRPQEGGFYGGWVTSEIVGPMKGAPGTGGW